MPKKQKAQPSAAIPKLEFPLSRNLTWIANRAKVIVDPGLSPSELLETLDILPLITDITLVVDPSPENLRSWGYDYQRFTRLTRERIFLPLLSEGSSPFAFSIRRKDLFDDERFLPEYESAIARDQEDDTFCDLSEEIGIDPNDAAFNINWDLITAQLMGAPIVSPPRLRSLWQHKFQASIRDLRETITLPPPVKNAHILKRFLYRAMEFPPSALSVEELIDFRRDKRSERFREWLGIELTKMSKVSQITQLRVDEEIYRDFNELANNYASSASRVSGTLSALSGIAGAYLGATLGGTLGAALGATPAILSTFGFPQILRRIWRKRAENNWIFLFLDFRSKPRL